MKNATVMLKEGEEEEKRELEADGYRWTRSPRVTLAPVWELRRVETAPQLRLE